MRVQVSGWAAGHESKYLSLMDRMTLGKTQGVRKILLFDGITVLSAPTGKSHVFWEDPVMQFHCTSLMVNAQ